MTELSAVRRSAISLKLTLDATRVLSISKLPNDGWLLNVRFS